METNRFDRVLGPPAYRTVVSNPDDRRTQNVAGPRRNRWIAVGLGDRDARRSLIPRFPREAYQREPSVADGVITCQARVGIAALLKKLLQSGDGLCG